MLAKWLANHVPVIKCNWCILKGWTGFATPFFIVVNDKFSVKSVKHEQAHVYQWWRGWIVGFATLYLYQLYKGGYYENEFEIHARLYQQGIISDLEGTWPSKD